MGNTRFGLKDGSVMLAHEWFKYQVSSGERWLMVTMPPYSGILPGPGMVFGRTDTESAFKLFCNGWKCYKK